MPQAKILVNGVIGSNDDLPINALVQLNNQNIGGESTYTWAILDQPPGTADALSSLIIQNPSFTPKKEGTYLVKVTVNLGLPDEQSDSVVVGIRQVKSRQRIPAAGETTQADTADGWATSMNALLRAMDSWLADPAIIVGVAGATGLSKGTCVRAAGGSVIKSGLPGQETVPNFTLCDATTLGKIDELIFVMEGAVVGGGTPALNALCRARYVGRLANTLVTGAAGVAGDTLFVSDTGALSTAPGTLRRQIGSIMNVIGGGYYDVMVDGVGGADITPIGAPYVIFGPGGTLTAAKRIDAVSPTPFTGNVVFLSGAGAVTPLIAKAHAAQSVDIFEVQSSAGAIYFKVDEFGVFDGVGQLSNNLGINASVNINWPNWKLSEVFGVSTEMRFDWQSRANTVKFKTDSGVSGETKIVLTAPGAQAGTIGVADTGSVTFIDGGPFLQLRSGNVKVAETYNTSDAGAMLIWSPDGVSRDLEFSVDQATGIIDIKAFGTGGVGLGKLTLNSKWQIDSFTGDLNSVGGAPSPQQIWGVSDPLYATSAVNLQTLQASETFLKQQLALPRRERFAVWPPAANGLWASPSSDYPSDLAWEAQSNNVYPSGSHTTRGRPTGQAAGQNSSLGLKVILNSVSRLVFSFRTTTTPVTGRLKLFIDGVTVFATPDTSSNDGGGMYVSDPLPAGFHKFTWRYEKTGAGAEVIAITDVSVFPEQDLREVSEGFIWQDDDWTLGHRIPVDSAATESVWRWFKIYTGTPGGVLTVDTDMTLKIMANNNASGDSTSLIWGPIARQVFLDPASYGCFIEFVFKLDNMTAVGKGFDFEIFNPSSTEKIVLSADIALDAAYWTFINSVGSRHVLAHALDSNWHTYRICINPAGVTFLMDTLNASVLRYSMPAAVESVSIPTPSFKIKTRFDGALTAPTVRFRSLKWRASKVYPAL
jgi:hypothetical protein